MWDRQNLRVLFAISHKQKAILLENFENTVYSMAALLVLIE